MYTWVIWAVTGFSLWEGRGRGALRPPCRMASTRLPGRALSEKAQRIWANLTQSAPCGCQGGSDWPCSGYPHGTRQMSCKSKTSPKDIEHTRYNSPNLLLLRDFLSRGWLEHQCAFQPTSSQEAQKWVARLAISSFKGRLDEKVIVYTLLAGGINPTTYIMKIE